MFVLLKVLLFFVRPLVWVVVLLVAAALLKNEAPKKKCFYTALGLLLFFSNPFFITKLIQAYEAAPMAITPAQTFGAGIVLGGFVSYNLAEDKGYFNPAVDRFVQTALLYKTGHLKTIIIAAGNGYLVKHAFREADFAKSKLVQLGIPDSVIYTDGLSKNTLQNAVNSKKIIDSLRLSGPFLLISSALHLPRAQLVFAHQGIAAQAYPCDFISKNVGNNFAEDVLLPSATALRNWDNLLKEWLGLLAYKITGKG